MPIGRWLLVHCQCNNYRHHCHHISCGWGFAVCFVLLNCLVYATWSNQGRTRTTQEWKPESYWWWALGTWYTNISTVKVCTMFVTGCSSVVTDVSCVISGWCIYGAVQLHLLVSGRHLAICWTSREHGPSSENVLSPSLVQRRGTHCPSAWERQHLDLWTCLSVHLRHTCVVCHTRLALTLVFSIACYFRHFVYVC